jgi:hypothetical protein
MRRVVTAGIGLLGIAAAACALGSLVSFEQLRPLGELVRRAEDLTPERYARYRHLCVFFAAGLTAAGITTARRLDWIISFLSGLRSRSPAPSKRPGNRCELLLLGIVVVAGILLRLQRLDDPVAYDEAYTYLNFARRPWYEAIGDYNSTNNHLLNTLLMLVTTRLFGAHEWSMRLHVFLAGCALPAVVFAWARTWCRMSSTVDAPSGEWDDGRRIWVAVPLLAAALTAIAPLLITYSTDARGYMLVALAAVLFDGLLAQARQAPGPRVWLGIWLSLVGGLCSMPLMLYAAIPSLMWFVLLRGRAAEATFTHSFGGRFRPLVPLLGTAALAVVLFYSPAYVFRGMMFLRDPIVQQASSSNFVLRLAECWGNAWLWWTGGVIPRWLWAALLTMGLLAFGRERPFRVRWLMPFAVVLAANVAQHVTPPPRIYLHLAPWVFLVAAGGVEVMGRSLCLRRPGRTRWACAAVTGVILIAGTIYAVPQRVLFHESERASFVSVPDVIERLDRELESRPEARDVLIAPLPCDLPSLFYMDRAGIQIPMNALPPSRGTAWLIARHDETPEDVLRSNLVGMSAEVDRFAEWEQVAAFETLDLYRAVRR